HPNRRKTRFRLLARLYRTGLVTRRVPAKGFRVSQFVSFSFPKLLGANAVPFFTAGSQRQRNHRGEEAAPRHSPTLECASFPEACMGEWNVSLRRTRRGGPDGR